MKALIVVIFLLGQNSFANLIKPTIPNYLSRERGPDKIYNGTYTNFSKYPHSAALIYENKQTDLYGLGCSGIFLNTRWILTAAHCIDTFNNLISKKDAKIYVLNGGIGDLKESLFKFKATKFIKNPLYQDAHEPGVEIVSHDYGLIKIEFDRTQCKKSSTHRKACRDIRRAISKLTIPSNELRKRILPTGVSIRMIGYGKDQDNWQPWHIAYVDIPTVPLKFVRRKYNDYLLERGFPQDEINMYIKLEVHEKYIFSYHPLKSGCFGDSGAPMIVEKYGIQYLLAVHSWGTANENDCDGIGAHSSLSFDDGWLNKTMMRN